MSRYSDWYVSLSTIKGYVQRTPVSGKITRRRNYAALALVMGTRGGVAAAKLGTRISTLIGDRACALFRTR